MALDDEISEIMTTCNVFSQTYHDTVLFLQRFERDQGQKFQGNPEINAQNC